MIKKNMKKDELHRIAQSEQKDITQAYRDGVVYEYILDRAIDIEKTNKGKIMKIYFSLDEPYIWLDFYCHPGYIFTAASGYENGASKIPLADWDQIQLEWKDKTKKIQEIFFKLYQTEFDINDLIQFETLAKHYSKDALQRNLNEFDSVSVSMLIGSIISPYNLKKTHPEQVQIMRYHLIAAMKELTQ